VTATAPRHADLDLQVWAPEATLAETHAHSRELKRLRRLHRLAGPVVLYLGPYVESGGLAAAVAAVTEVHQRHPEVRLVALPRGKVNRRYLNRCERQALGLGHHGIVEWTLVEEELPFWFALAAVVIAPDRDATSPVRADLAAAAGRPIVAGRFPETVSRVVDGETGYLLATPVDPADLARHVAVLLDDPELADRLGAAARERLEASR
jgi:glycosyltransferase involved in cell wall biosynthesis